MQQKWLCLRFAKETPHLSLFKKVAAVVHHGGSGTTHTSAKAGVPQLILPQIADQFYWGGRVTSLGLGPKSLPFAKLSVQNLASNLLDLKEKTEYSENAKKLSLDICAEKPIESILGLVRKHLEYKDLINKKTTKVTELGI